MSKNLLIRCIKNMDREHTIEFLNDLWAWAQEHEEQIGILVDLLEAEEMFLPIEASQWEEELVRLHFKTMVEGCVDLTDDLAQQFLTHCLEDLGWEFNWS